MYLLIVFLPFLVSIISGLCGRFLGFWGATYLTLNSLFKAFLISSSVFCNIAVGKKFNIKLTSWISCGDWNVDKRKM